MADRSVASGSKWDEQIKNLKEQKEKKEQGLDYSVDNSITTEREKRSIRSATQTVRAKTEVKTNDNPYVRKVTLDELINISRKLKGEPQRAPERKTPFISREKELSAPQLSKRH
jgi:hypothetical protein